MYSLPGYIEKKKKRIKNCHYGKKRSNNDKKQYCKKKFDLFWIRSKFQIDGVLPEKKIKRSEIEVQETIEILPINIVIQTWHS